MLKVHALSKTHLEAYEYDSLGNRTKLTVDGNVKTSTYYKNAAGGNLPLIQNDGSYSYTYDDNGNRLTKTKVGESWEYGWDLYNRLVQVKKNGATVANYTYDGDNLRVQKSTASETTVYAFGRSGAITYQKNVTHDTEKTYTYIGGSLIGWREKNAGVLNQYFATTDHLGSVTQVTDSTGTVIWSSEYLPFGALAGVQGTYAFDGIYGGHQADSDIGLVYMWNRWQDPSTGTFISEDSARDGSNWYGYAGNSPLTKIDPTGLAEQYSSTFNSVPSYVYRSPGYADYSPQQGGDSGDSHTPQPITKEELDLFVDIYNKNFKDEAVRKERNERIAREAMRDKPNMEAVVAAIYDMAMDLYHQDPNKGTPSQHNVRLTLRSIFGNEPESKANHLDVVYAALRPTDYAKDAARMAASGISMAGVLGLGLSGGFSFRGPKKGPTVDPANKNENTTESRREAFRKAKRDLGIPNTQQPDSVKQVELTDKFGQKVIGPDGKPVKSREYTYTRPNGEKVTIQDHGYGHQFGDGGSGDQGPHFNVRPADDLRNGTVPGTQAHYPFNLRN